MASDKIVFNVQINTIDNKTVFVEGPLAYIAKEYHKYKVASLMPNIVSVKTNHGSISYNARKFSKRVIKETRNLHKLPVADTSEPTVIRGQR